MDRKKIFATNLKKYRKEKRLTQRELGDKIGLNHRSISDYETCTNDPGVEILYKLCDVLDKTPNQLLGYNESATNIIHISHSKEFRVVAEEL